MENSNKLKEYRLLRSLTQRELAKSSGISIRTIQRIEKGQAVGSPHTIKTLAKTLEIDNTELLLGQNKLAPIIDTKNTAKLKLMNLSILTLLFIPFGNLIFPSLLFYRYKELDEKVNTEGRKILSCQLLSVLILPFAMILVSVVMGRGNGQIPIGVFLPYLLYLAANIIISIRTALHINQDK